MNNFLHQHAQIVVLMLFKGADLTARMRRLVCAFVVHKFTEHRVSRYPESNLIRIKNNNVVRLDSSRLGMGRISILCLQGGKRITIIVDLKIDDNCCKQTLAS